MTPVQKIIQYIFNFLSRYFIMTSLSPMPNLSITSSAVFPILGTTTDGLGDLVVTATGLTFPVTLPASVGSADNTGLLIQVTYSDGSVAYTLAPATVPAVAEVGFFVALPQFEAGATIESVVTGTQYTNAASTSVTFPEIEGQWIVVTPAPVAA